MICSIRFGLILVLLWALDEIPSMYIYALSTSLLGCFEFASLWFVIEPN